MNKFRIISVVLILGLAAAVVPLGTSQPPNASLAKLMKEKLKSSQTLMEGVALGDFDKIRRSADELARLSKTEEWMVYKTPRYEVFSNDFRRSVDTIYQRAKDKNIDAVVKAYGEMMTTCVRCHEHVREIREARAPLLPPEATPIVSR